MRMHVSTSVSFESCRYLFDRLVCESGQEEHKYGTRGRTCRRLIEGSTRRRQVWHAALMYSAIVQMETPT